MLYRQDFRKLSFSDLNTLLCHSLPAINKCIYLLPSYVLYQLRFFTKVYTIETPIEMACFLGFEHAFLSFSSGNEECLFLQYFSILYHTVHECICYIVTNTKKLNFSPHSLHNFPVTLRLLPNTS